MVRDEPRFEDVFVEKETDRITPLRLYKRFNKLPDEQQLLSIGWILIRLLFVVGVGVVSKTMFGLTWQQTSLLILIITAIGMLWARLNRIEKIEKEQGQKEKAITATRIRFIFERLNKIEKRLDELDGKGLE